MNLGEVRGKKHVHECTLVQPETQPLTSKGEGHLKFLIISNIFNISWTLNLNLIFKINTFIYTYFYMYLEAEILRGLCIYI